VTAASPPPAPGPQEYLSYWSVVGEQLRKNRVAMAALWLARGLILVAVAAPLLAMNLPWAAWEGGSLSSPLAEGLFDRFVFANGVDIFFNLALVLGALWWTGSRCGAAVRRRRSGGGARATASAAAWAFVFVAVAALFLSVGVLRALRTERLGAFFETDLGRLTVFFGLPGGVFLGVMQAIASPERVGRLRWARVGAGVFFVLAFALLMGPWRSTRPLLDWTERAAQLEATHAGWALFPPCRFHPDNVGESGPGPASRSLKRPGGENVLGCDLNGRDVLARLIFGTRISMTIGLLAAAIFVLIGSVLGSLAGYYAGKVDLLIQRMVEVMMCFPGLFLILTIVAVFESRSIFLIMAVIGLVGWPNVTRLVRGEFLRQRSLDYVVAARALGVPERRVIFGHVFPNCVGPVLVSATFGIASSILTESGLAFLGLGDTTAVSWGQMLTAGRSEGQWHLIFAPGLAIFFVVTVFNLLGEGLRDALDPKLRR
jgi:peptide/nickel transport system permease protein